MQEASQQSTFPSVFRRTFRHVPKLPVPIVCSTSKSSNLAIVFGMIWPVWRLLSILILKQGLTRQELKLTNQILVAFTDHVLLFAPVRVRVCVRGCYCKELLLRCFVWHRFCSLDGWRPPSTLCAGAAAAWTARVCRPGAQARVCCPGGPLRSTQKLSDRGRS